MMALNLIKQKQINRLCVIGLNNQLANLSTIKLKIDGKQVNIDDLPKKPKLDLFEKYCKDMGYSNEQLKTERNEILKSFNTNKTEFMAKNKKLIDEYQLKLKEYNQLFKQPITLGDVKPLLKFYNKTIEKQNQPKNKRKLSLYNFYVKNEYNQNTNLKELANKFKNLSSSELENYKKLYDNYLREQ